MLTKTIGDLGEELATSHLLKLGHEILVRNFRYKRAEIDIISKKGDVIHFVEVKYRKNASFGHGELAVTEHKLNMLHLGAEGFMDQHQWNGHIQFDIIAITGNHIELFEDIN